MEKPNRGFLIEVQKGNIAGHMMVHKFGRNGSVPNGSWEFVNLLGFTAWPLSAPATVRIKAGGDVADTTAGAGAREITVQGIDSNLNEAAEAIATAGAAASVATATSFWRIHRAWVSSVGTYGAANTGSVTIENSGGGTDLIEIGIEKGQTQFAAWTVPIGKTACLLSMHVQVDTNLSANIRVYTRANMDNAVAPMSAKRLRLFFAVRNNFPYLPKGPEVVIDEKSDFWVEASGDGAIVKVTCNFELLVIDKNGY